ncbi:MAG: hit [Candidatus Magasanikbacteria bacterium]|nr:hit [Candidatus Magasanikbacteria bacterium]
MDCIFCKIVSGEIPSARVFEDDNVIAFLDIRPIAKGHTLIVPKKHLTDLRDADYETLCHLMGAVKKIAPSVMTAVGADGFNLGGNNGPASGQEVMHLHLHIIPRHFNDGLPRWPHNAYAEGEREGLAEKIRAVL